MARAAGKFAVCFVAMEMPLETGAGKRLAQVGGRSGGQSLYMRDVPWAVEQKGIASFVVKPLFSADVKKDYQMLEGFLAAFKGSVLAEIQVPVGFGAIPIKIIYIEQEGVPVLLLYDEAESIFTELYASPDSLAGYIEAIVLPRAALIIQQKLDI